MKTLGLFLIVFAARAQTNFSGVWELDEAGRTMRVKIDQQGDNFEITTRAMVRGNLEQQSQKAVIGRDTKGEMHGAPATSHAEWDGGALVVRSVAVIMNKELRLVDRYSLAPDGQTLTFHERHQYGAEPEGEESHTFRKKDASTWEPDAPPKPAEEVYKNIQTLKGVPAPRLPTVMMNLTRWLGVECAHCHVMGQFEKDDKPAKETARKMFRMVRTIGQEFAGSNPVTCWTCHRGQAKPQSLPPQ